MKFLVNKTESLSGTISIPGNKSGTARALILGALTEGTTTIRNPLHNADSYSILHMLESMGAEFDISDDNFWRVKGTGGKLKQPINVLDVGNSGTGYYCCTWLASSNIISTSLCTTYIALLLMFANANGQSAN